MGRKKVTYRSGVPRFTDDDAQVIGSFLDTQFPDGVVTPEGVVDAARSAHSPIHQYFEWDDTVAAERYRRRQASRLIAAVVVEYNDQPVRQFTTSVILEDSTRGHVRTNKAVNNPSLWEQVLETALFEAQQWADRYKRYEQLAPIRQVITETKKRVRERRAM